MLPVDKIVLTKSTLFNFWNISIFKTLVSACSSQINQSARVHSKPSNGREVA